jgi:membrane fusion protein (multidrug efflux system)
LGLSQARLTRMAVQAPFDGTAGIRLVNVGDYVKDGVDLVPLEDTRQMLVDFRLPERYGSKVKPGQGVEVTLDALPGRSFMATVEAVDPLMDANGRSVGVRALISGAGTSGAQATVLRSGMFARVTTVFSVNDAALVVPEEAIVPQGNRQLVYKLLPPDAGATVPTDVKWVARRQEVKLGVRGRGVVEILDGLKAGDTVVVAGQQRLQKDGSPVRIVELGRPGDKTGDAASANSADVPVKGQAGPASR